MEQSPHYLVIGGDSALGSSLANRLTENGASVLETTRRPNRVSTTKLFFDMNGDVDELPVPCIPSVAFLCAAVTSLQVCRNDPIGSARINVHNTLLLARKLLDIGAFVIFPSTNLVFDGSKPFRRAEETVCPLTEYGRQKAETEIGLRDSRGSVAVVRLTKVLGNGLKLFEEWLHCLRNDIPIHPFSDMTMSPITMDFTVTVLLEIAKRRIASLFQVSGADEITYEQAGKHIACFIGADSRLVQPIKVEESGWLPESLPKHTTLDTSGIEQELGLIPPNIREAVESVCKI